MGAIRCRRGSILLLGACLFAACDEGDDGRPIEPTSSSRPTATLPAPSATPSLLPTATGTPTSSPTRTATRAPTPTAPASGPIVIAFDFRQGDLGWQAGFADYPPGDDESFELAAGVRTLPPELGTGTGFLLQSHNRSDDVFMFLKRRLGAEDGLLPSAAYRLSFTLALGSNAQSGCSGIGGAPGESVYLKAGGSPLEPVTALQPDGLLRLNVDKGDQSEGGPAASVAGDIANGIECGSAPATYVSLQRAHDHPAEVVSGGDGTLWLLVGTDSGYEGLTAIFFQRLEVRLEQVAGEQPHANDAAASEGLPRHLGVIGVRPLPPGAGEPQSPRRPNLSRRRGFPGTAAQWLRPGTVAATTRRTRGVTRAS